MPEVKKPQDHQKKVEITPFTFDAGDKTYELPPAAKGAEVVSGRLVRDASMGGDSEQLKLGFTLLEACGVDQPTLDALYDQPAARTLKIITDWMEHEDGSEVAIPQS